MNDVVLVSPSGAQRVELATWPHEGHQWLHLSVIDDDEMSAAGYPADRAEVRRLVERMSYWLRSTGESPVTTAANEPGH